MMEWKPIETAPRDGRRVLVWLDEESLKREQRQVQLARLWFYEDGSLGGGAEGFHGKWNITHWMPAPEAPNFVVDAESPDMAVRPADNMARIGQEKPLKS